MTDHTVGTDFQGRPVDRSFSDAELESSAGYDNPQDYGMTPDRNRLPRAVLTPYGRANIPGRSFQA